MDQPAPADAPAVRRRWADSVVVDLVLAIILVWVGMKLGRAFGYSDAEALGGLAGIALAFVVAGCRASATRWVAHLVELYLCCIVVTLTLDVLHRLLCAYRGCDPYCGHPCAPSEVWREFGPETLLNLATITFPAVLGAVLGGIIAWVVRCWRSRSSSCAR